MTSVDYREVALYVDNVRVKQLFVLSLAAERFWRLAFHDARGMAGLRPHHVERVEVRNAYRNEGGRKIEMKSPLLVALTREDSRLALRVAEQIVTLVESKGYRILDAIQPQKDANNKKVGEHDLVCEKRGQTGSDRGLSSMEIKLRAASTMEVLTKERKRIQKLGYKLWPWMKEESDGRWRDRVVVLLRWTKVQDEFNLACSYDSSYAESVSRVSQDWEPQWGWASKLETESAKALRKASEAKAKAKAAKAAEVEATKKVRANLAFDKKWRGCRKTTMHRKEMGSISDVLKDINTAQCKKVRPNINQRLPVWTRKWKWPRHSWSQDTTGKCASKTGGGRGGYVATYEAMRHIFDHVTTAEE